MAVIEAGTGTGATARGAGTRDRALDVAERLIQLRGFNAFSYADIATELGVTKASLHYHFPGKAELGDAVITRYTERFLAALSALDATSNSAPAKLDAYVELYLDVLRGGRMCLCGMLATEYQTLPASMLDAVKAFFAANEAWLESLLEQGRRAGTVISRAPSRATARLIVSTLQGAMLVARPLADVKGFRTTARTLVKSITAT